MGPSWYLLIRGYRPNADTEGPVRQQPKDAEADVLKRIGVFPENQMCASATLGHVDRLPRDGQANVKALRPPPVVVAGAAAEPVASWVMGRPLARASEGRHIL